jgi:hypothetical protein
MDVVHAPAIVLRPQTHAATDGNNQTIGARVGSYLNMLGFSGSAWRGMRKACTSAVRWVDIVVRTRER